MSHIHPKIEKRKLSINLSLFATFTESFSIEKPTKSPRNFENGGGVGLGIVAAMNDLGGDNNNNNITQESVKFNNFAVSPRSNPIPIICSAKPAANFKGSVGLMNFERDNYNCGVVVDENDESYTCVISRVGNNVIKKHVYYDDQVGDSGDSVSVFDVNPGGLFYTSTSPMVMSMNDGGAERRGIWTTDFLSSCYLCNKLLHGLDIFMYRGEKAFCSVECRDNHIAARDKYKEKCRSEARKPPDYSISPCSSPQVYFAGLVAA